MAVGEIGSTAAGSSATTQSNSIMGKDDFLKLLVAQLKNQDPSSPVDGTQFASQLAQFSSLEQLSNLNTSMTQSIQANLVLTQSINNSLTANLIGKDVKLGVNNFSYTGQDSTELGYSLPSNAQTADIQVYDSSGNLVRTIHDVPQSQGDHKVSWDFCDDDGNKVPEGDYTFKVDAKDFEGKDITADTYITGTINGVKFADDGTKILVGDSEYSISDILEILNPTGNGDYNG